MAGTQPPRPDGYPTGLRQARPQRARRTVLERDAADPFQGLRPGPAPDSIRGHRIRGTPPDGRAGTSTTSSASAIDRAGEGSPRRKEQQIRRRPCLEDQVGEQHVEHAHLRMRQPPTKHRPEQREPDARGRNLRDAPAPETTPGQPSQESDRAGLGDDQACCDHDKHDELVPGVFETACSFGMADRLCQPFDALA